MEEVKEVEKNEVIQIMSFHRCPECGGGMELLGINMALFRYVCLACEKKKEERQKEVQKERRDRIWE